MGARDTREGIAKLFLEDQGGLEGGEDVDYGLLVGGVAVGGLAGGELTPVGVHGDALAGLGEGEIGGGEVVGGSKVVGQIVQAIVFGQINGHVAFGNDTPEELEGVFAFFQGLSFKVIAVPGSG